MAEKTKKDKILLTQNAFNKKNNFEKKVKEIEVPELNALMGLSDSEVAIIEISQISLSDYLKLRTDVIDYTQNLIEGVLSAASKKEEVKDEMLNLWDKMTPDVKFRVNIVQKGVINPKLNRSDVIFLSKMFPITVLKLSEQIIELTNKGAGLKKNS